MTTPTLTLPQVLRGGADILQVNGRARGVFYEVLLLRTPAECPVCALGALALAAGCDLDNMTLGNPRTPAERLAMDAARALGDHLGLLPAGTDATPANLISFVGNWSDTAESTDQIIAALRETADAVEQAATSTAGGAE